MNIQEEVIQSLYKEFDQDKDQVEFYDERGDQRHFYLRVISDKFTEMPRIQRSKMVYKIINDFLQQDHIHALRMELKTPSEFNQ